MDIQANAMAAQSSYLEQAIQYKRPCHSLLSILLACAFWIPFLAGCSTADVESRQAGITNAQAGVQERRAARIKARDERMRSSREVWFQ